MPISRRSAHPFRCLRRCRGFDGEGDRFGDARMRRAAAARPPFEGYGPLVAGSERPARSAARLQLPRVLARGRRADRRRRSCRRATTAWPRFRPARSAPGWCATTRSAVDDVTKTGCAPVPHVPGATYDPEGVGGTTTLLVGHARPAASAHRVSLAGTLDQLRRRPDAVGHLAHLRRGRRRCWASRTATCSRSIPWRGGNPEPIRAMGRFEHEAVGVRSPRPRLPDRGRRRAARLLLPLPARAAAARARQPARGRQPRRDGGRRA